MRTSEDTPNASPLNLERRDFVDKVLLPPLSVSVSKDRKDSVPYLSVDIVSPSSQSSTPGSTS